MNTKSSKVAFIMAGLFITSSLVVSYLVPDKAVSAETENTNFTVNIAETLAVSLTVPDNGDSGDPNDFLRNDVLLEVFSNISGSGAGFTASMYAENTTNLTHTNNNYLKTINGNTDVLVPTLASSSTRSAFPTGYWGYSLEGQITNVNGYTDSRTYGESTTGVDSSQYYPLTTSTSSPITIFSSNTAEAKSRHIFFGAKPSAAQPSGTYAGTVVINVVTGTINSSTNPITPTDPATNNEPSGNNPSYTPDSNYPSDPSRGRTVYTSVSSNTPASTTTTTTVVSSGDTTSSYASPAGETESTFADINSGSTLAYGLAAAAGVAATSGILFFVLAKRDDDDDEEEDPEQQ